MCNSCLITGTKANQDQFILNKLNEVLKNHDYRLGNQQKILIVGSIRSLNIGRRGHCDIIFTPNKWYHEDADCSTHYAHEHNNKLLEKLRLMYYGLAPLEDFDVDDDEEEENDECPDCGCEECECDEEEEEEDDDF